MPCNWNELNFNPFMSIDWRGRQHRLGNVIRTWICLTEAARGRSEHASWLSYFFDVFYCSVVFTLFIYSMILSYFVFYIISSWNCDVTAWICSSVGAILRILFFCDLWIICVFVPFCKSLSFFWLFDLFSIWEFVLRCLAFVCCDVQALVLFVSF